MRYDILTCTFPYVYDFARARTYRRHMRRWMLVLLLIAMPTFALADSPIAWCRDHAPASVWDDPSCEDDATDRALIDAAQRGDRSAIDSLEQRYAAAFTYAQRIRIGGALLNRVRDDRAIWKELAALAEIVEFTPPASDLRSLARAAFIEIATDKRARALMLRGLELDDEVVVFAAIYGLAQQNDMSALPAIEKAIERLPDYRRELTLALREFRSREADTIAMKFMGEDV